MFFDITLGSRSRLQVQTVCILPLCCVPKTGGVALATPSCARSLLVQLRQLSDIAPHFSTWNSSLDLFQIGGCSMGHLSNHIGFNLVPPKYHFFFPPHTAPYHDITWAKSCLHFCFLSAPYRESWSIGTPKDREMERKLTRGNCGSQEVQLSTIYASSQPVLVCSI